MKVKTRGRMSAAEEDRMMMMMMMLGGRIHPRNARQTH